jgi:hypothetical protein
MPQGTYAKPAPMPPAGLFRIRHQSMTLKCRRRCDGGPPSRGPDLARACVHPTGRRKVDIVIEGGSSDVLLKVPGASLQDPCLVIQSSVARGSAHGCGSILTLRARQIKTETAGPKLHFQGPQPLA